MTTKTVRKPQLSLVCRAVVYQICLMMALQPAHPAFAEGIAVATGNTTLNQAGNGVPIVDIATPNGAGISHNLYTDFNVGQAGTILNNATGQLTQTQLGGLIQNNPHLNGQAASAIINEVVGVNPSQLQGYLEVAGQQAGVVVANPNGLTCDGCGFINTPTVTLSTGKPVLDANGQLQMLDVKRGTLTVGGKGLDASRQTSIDLVARAVQLNGALHGKDVNLVAGANLVNRQTGEIRVQAGEGPAPVVAIDTAALGGMYAGKIRLVSTEQGVGVNLANSVARQGDLTLDANGIIRLSDASATGAMQVTGRDDIALAGTIQAGGSARIEAKGALTAQDADIKAAQDAHLQARSLQLNNGKLTSGGTLALKVDEGAVLQGSKLQADAIDANALVIDNRASMTAKRVTLQADQLTQAGDIQGDTVRLSGANLRNEGSTRAGQELVIQAHRLDNKGELKSGQTLSAELGDGGRNDGLLSSTGSLEIRAVNQWEQGAQGKTEAGTQARLQANNAILAGEVGAQTVAVNAGTLAVNGKVRGSEVQLLVGTLANQGEVQAGQTLTWQGDRLDNRGSLQGDKRLELKGGILANQGSLAGGDSLVIQAGQLINTGRIASQDVALEAQKLTSDGTLLGVSRLELKGDELVLRGQQLTDGELQLGSRLLQLTGQTLVGGHAKVSAEEGEFGGLVKAQSLVLAVNQATSEGKLHSLEGIAWLGQQLTTGQESELIANQNVTLTGQEMTLGGTVGAGNTFEIKGKQVSQTGALASGQTLSIQSDNLSLNGETEAKAVNIHADAMTVAGKVRGSEVQLQVGTLANQGEVQAGQTLTWQGDQLDNRGSLQGDKSLVLKGDTLANQGALAGGDSLVIQAGQLTNTGRIASQDVALEARKLTSDGTLLGVSRLELKGDELVLRGQQLTDGELQLGSRLLQLTGQTLVGGHAKVSAEEGKFGGLVKAQSLVLAVNQATSEGKLHSLEGIAWLGQRLTTGQESELIANQNVTLTGQEMTLGGTVGAGNTVEIKGKQVSQTGALASGQDLTIDADSLSLGGQVEGGSITLRSDSGTQQGRLLAAGNLTWQSKRLEGNGWMQAGDALMLSGDELTHRGTALTQGSMAFEFADLNSQGELFAQDLVLTGSRLTLNGALETTGGARLQAEALHLGGALRTGTDLTLGATLLTLSGSQQVGGALQLQAEQAAFASELEVGKQLKINTKVLHSDGKILAKQAEIDAAQWDQNGSLTTEDGLVWRGTRLTQQGKGALQAGGKLSLTGEAVSLEGTVASKSDVAIDAGRYVQSGTMNAAQSLRIDADSLQLGGTTQAKQAELHSREGESSGQHLVTQGLLWQSDMLSNRGWLQAGEGLNLDTRTLDNEGTAIAGGQNTLVARDRLNNLGNLAGNRLSLTAGQLQSSGLLQGKQGVDLKADQANLTGRLTSQGAVQLGASLLALGGDAQIGGPLTLQADEQQMAGTWRIGGLLHSTGKQLVLNGDWQASQWQLMADTLANRGRLASEQIATFQVGEVSNHQGATLVAGGPLTLTGKRLVQEGIWLGAGDQLINVDDVQQRGQWTGDGSLRIAGEQLLNTGALRAADMVLNVDTLENQGRLESSDVLNWEGSQWRNLGALIAGQAALSGHTLLNSGDLGVRHLTMTATDRLTNSGVLVGKEGMSLTAATLDSQGDMLSNGALTLGADLLTLGGMTQVLGDLTLDAKQASLSGNVMADRLQWHGQRLALAGTAAAREAQLSGDHITLDGSLTGNSQILDASTLITGKASSLLAKETQRLKADQMTLQGNAVAGQGQQIDADQLTQHGVLASGGTLALQVTGTLRNEGNLSGDALTLEAGHIDNGGALVSKGALVLKTGDLNNRGHWQSDQGITLTASRLLNSGQWVSGLAQSLTLTELVNSGTLLAGAGLSLNAQHINSSGKLLAKQDLSLAADDVRLDSGSTTASNGQLILSAADLVSAGSLSAAGDLSWQGQRFSHSGTAVTEGALTLRGDTLTLDGALQGGRLQLDTGNMITRGSLHGRDGVTVNARGTVQHDGQLQGGNLTLNSASWQGMGAVGSDGSLVLRTGQLQQQGPWRIRGMADIQADTMTLSGSLVSGGDLTLLSRGALTSQAGSQLVSGGALSVDGGVLTQQGLWQSGRGMKVKGNRFEQQGDVLAGGDITLRTASWLQSGKTRTNGALNAELTGVSTLAGTLQADGGITLSAPSLTLKGTLASKGNVSLTSSSLMSQLGNLLSGGELMLTASRIEQQGRIEADRLQSRGELQNDGVMLVAVQGSLSGNQLDNRGTLQGDSLTVSSRQLDNRGALLGNNLVITSDGVANSGRVQGGSLRLETQLLDNGQGAVIRAQSLGDITATSLNNAGEISSAGQLLLKGSKLDNGGLVSANWLNASPLARLVNSGTLFAQQMTLNSAEINAPGKILAGQKATLDAGRVTGIGEWLSGGDLALKVGSSLSSQGSLSAKGLLDLQVQGNWQHQGQWGAGQRFNAGVTGELNNDGALVSNGVMQLSAQRLENNGSVQSGQGLTLNTQGELRNTGFMASNGDLSWQGDSLYNRGTIYSGGIQNLTANSNLTNEYGTLLAERGATLRVNNGQLVNASGTIDAGSGDLWLSASEIINKRAVFELTKTDTTSGNAPLELTLDKDDALLPVHQLVWNRIAFIPSASYLWMAGVKFPSNSDVSIKLSLQSQVVAKDSRQGEILAAGNAAIKAGALLNDASRIAVGGSLDVTATALANKSYPLGGAVEYADYHYQFASNLGFSETRSVAEGSPNYIPDYKLHYTLSGMRTEQTDAGSVNALISAGGNLTGMVAGMIDNVTIKAHAGPVSSTTQRPAISLPQAQGVGAAPGLQGDAQYLAQVLKPVGPDNGVPLPDFQLLTGDKGLFTVSTNGNSPYLIEVNPLLANLGQAGDDMMGRIDAALQQQLQGAGQLSFDGVSGNGGGVSQATGQHTGWTLPGRVTGGGQSPDFQSLDGAHLIGNGHASISPQWQQSLQQGANLSGQGPQVAGDSTGAAGQWQQSLQNNWQNQGVAGVAAAVPDTVQISNQPVPALATAPVVETNPSLTRVDQFLGSSYFFAQVGFTPEQDIKLLGDAAFDTRIIRDAVLAQTGQRFLNNELGSDLAQMRALIDNAVQNQRELGLNAGVALTREQVAQLGHSMVWWEPVWYQGKIVLAPKLYLTEADKQHLSGSVITADNIDLTAGGISNSGTLLADGTLSLKSGSTLVNQGQILAGDRLELIAKGDIINQNLIKGGEVAIASLDGSVRNETQTAQRHVDVNGVLSGQLTDQTRFSRTDVGDIARIESSGNLLLQAGQDIQLSAAELLAGLDLSLQAGNDILIGSVEQRQKWEAGRNRFERVDQLMSELQAGGNLTLSAGNDIAIGASRLQGGGDVSLVAANDLMLSSEANETSDEVHRGSTHNIDRTSIQQGVNISGDNLSLHAGNNLLAQASTLDAKGDATLQAGGELQLLTADNEVYHFEKSKSKSTFKSKTTEIEQKDVTAQGTTITAGGNVSLVSQGDMTLKGSDIQATDTLSLDTDGQLNLLTATDEHFYRKDEKKSGVMVKMSGNGTNSTTERQNQLDGAEIDINAGQGALLQVGQREGESLQARLDTLATQPGMAWVEQVRSMPGVKMDAVQEAYEQWNYSQQSLSPVASSIIAIALAVATMGAGTAALAAAQGVTTASLTGTASAAMANAAFSTLVSQATVSTINNGGDLGAVLKEMGSSASIKQLATSVATAGALQGLDKAMGWASAAPTASNAASQPAASNLFSWDTFNRVTSHSAVTAGINTAINGSNFADAFKASLLSNIQGQVGKSVAGVIGDNSKALGEVGKVVAHGVTSGAIAEITGGKFAAGAAGGAMSELASNWSLGAFGGNEEYQVALNKVLGGLAAAAVTGDENDFDTGADRAETVYRYNAMAHTLAALKARDPERFAKLMEAKQEQFKACGESPECKNVAIAGFGLVGLPLLPSELLLAAGIGGGANTGFQLWSNDGDFSKVDATEAVFSAYLSAGTAGWGFWSTVSANGAGGAYMNYLKGEDPLNGGISSGIGAGLGYGLGKLIEIPMDIKWNPNYKNYEWTSIGLGITKQPGRDIIPSTTGNVIGSVSSEWTSKTAEEIIKNDYKK